jgi:SpoVK/Ycf46/Vps4 family AAA+-type ATPase
MPGPAERARIWELQIHPRKTPLAADVDFRRLAERYTLSGGDIKNAVLKAAALAAAEPGPDLGKRISQHHFERAVENVLAAKTVMQQSLFSDAPIAAITAINGRAPEAQSRTVTFIALVLGGIAFITALVAIALALLR